MQSLAERLQADDPEERQIISGVSWEQYEALLEELGDSSLYRVTYLDGVLELMAPSRRHERNKSTIGSLLEAYCQEKRIRYFPLGSTTLRKQQKRGGTEPDESYCIGSDKEYPDIAIEVIETSGSINKLEVYQRLGVREVWFFQNKQFKLYALRESGYEQIDRSEILPDLDLTLLATAALAADPLEAALEFRQKIRQSN
jgi:Uma2 family endonuclease